MKESEKRTCFNCKYWQMDPESLDRRHYLLAQFALKKATNEEVEASKIMYGKCKATYLDKESNLEIGSMYNYGTLGGFICECKDNRGKILFEKVPK